MFEERRGKKRKRLLLVCDAGLVAAVCVEMRHRESRGRTTYIMASRVYRPRPLPKADAIRPNNGKHSLRCSAASAQPFSNMSMFLSTGGGLMIDIFS